MMKVTKAAKHLAFAYNPRNVPTAIAQRYLRHPLNPIYPKIMHMYAIRDRNTLWWQVTVVDALSHKKVVRSRSMRQTRAAFREALRERGFDADGRRIVSDSCTEEGLRGSLLILILQPGLRADFEAIKKDVDKLLEFLLRNT